MKEILEVAILEMGRTIPGGSFCPEEVVKWIYPQAWEHFLDEVNDAMMHLYKEGKVVVTREGVEVPEDKVPCSGVKIKLVH